MSQGHLMFIKVLRRISETSLPLSTKAPAMLPTKHWFTELVIRDTHERVKHSGIRNTLATVRERFWMVRGRETVKKSLRHCVVCRKVEGVPYRPPRAPDLPNYRVSDDPPFSHTGLDFAGPLYVKGSKNDVSSTCETTSSKVWVLLLTCAATRAVHLELVRGLQSCAKMFWKLFPRTSLIHFPPPPLSISPLPHNNVDFF